MPTLLAIWREYAGVPVGVTGTMVAQAGDQVIFLVAVHSYPFQPEKGLSHYPTAVIKLQSDGAGCG